MLRMNFQIYVELTANSKHDLPVADNLVDQNFAVSKPNESGYRTLLTFRQMKDGYISLAKWICMGAGSLAGQWIAG
jgi:hypothetical protein